MGTIKTIKMPHLILLPLLAALLLILSFPRFNQGYLAWFALLPLFFYCRRTGSGKKVFAGGMLTGFLFFLYLYAYIALAINFLFPPYLGILAVIFASFYSSVFFACFTLAFTFLLRQNRPLLTAVAASSLWVLLEYVRTAGLLGHSGGFLGYSQADYTLLLPLVSVYGYWGLPFAMVLFQVALFHVLIAIKNQNVSLSRRTLALPFLLFSIFLAAGLSFPSLFPVEENEKTLRIVMVQGNIPQEDILNPAMAQSNFDTYIALTETALTRYSSPDLIVWPETVFTLNVARYRPDAAAELARLAGKAGAPLFFGAMFADRETGNIYNSILLQRPGFDTFDPHRYDKHRLVPFAEYFPLPDLFNRIFKSGVSLGMYKPGRDAAPFPLDDFTIGGLVCFESYFPHPALKIARQGADHIFVLTNNAWFLQSIGLDQHIRAAPFRAAELGMGVTQVANSGISNSYDYRGRKVFAMPAHWKGASLLETSMPRRQTLYRLWGDYFVLLCVVALVFSLLYSRCGSRRKRH